MFSELSTHFDQQNPPFSAQAHFDGLQAHFDGLYLGINLLTHRVLAGFAPQSHTVTIQRNTLRPYWFDRMSCRGMPGKTYTLFPIPSPLGIHYI